MTDVKIESISPEMAKQLLLDGGTVYVIPNSLKTEIGNSISYKLPPYAALRSSWWMELNTDAKNRANAFKKGSGFNFYRRIEL